MRFYKNNMRYLATAAFLLISLGMPLVSLAETDWLFGDSGSTDSNYIGNSGSISSGETLVNPLQGGGTLESFLTGILQFIIRIGTIIVILMLVYVGFKFVTARGEPAEITKARTMLLWTVVGGLVLIGAVVIKDGIMATVQALR